MRAEIDPTRALARHPEQARAALAELTAKRQRKGRPALDVDAVAWVYDFAVLIEPVKLDPVTLLPEAPRENSGPRRISLALLAEAEGQTGVVRFTRAGETLTGADVPPEVDALLNPELITPENMPHLGRIDVLSPGGVTLILITGGYRAGKDIFLDTHRPGAPLPREPRPGGLYQVTEYGLEFAGIMTKTAWERYSATPEGGTFTYRNKVLTRLTAAEIRALPRVTFDPGTAEAEPDF